MGRFFVLRRNPAGYTSLPSLAFAIGFCVYLSAALVRHAWLQSSAWDLGIFDQAVDLIGRGWPADSSLLGFHILGDHGAVVLYPLGWLSRLIPSPFLLLVLQSAALAGAVFPLAELGRLRGLKQAATVSSMAVLLLYPVVFNTAIFDFHPEVLAFPLVMQSILLLERRAFGDDVRVALLLLLVLTCKVSLAFLVLGFAIAVFVRRRWLLGSVLALQASLWFGCIGGLVMPAFGGPRASLWRQASKFGLPGGSDLGVAGSAGAGGILATMVRQLVSTVNLEYLVLLLVPVLYVLLHQRRLAFLERLLPAAPLVLMNLAAAISPMKDLVHHYSLMLVPFVAGGVQATLAPGASGVNAYPQWFRDRAPTLVLIWAALAFVVFSRLTFFFGPFQERLDALAAVKAVAPLVAGDSRLLTNNHLAPHFSHRRSIELAGSSAVPLDLGRFDQVLLDERRPGWNANTELVREIRARLAASVQWKLRFDRDGVWLFERRPSDSDRVTGFRQQ